MTRVSILFLIAFFLAGCATGPQYANLRTPDAATLLDETLTNGGGPHGERMIVKVKEIDGAATPFSSTCYYLTPGWHHLEVYVDNRWDQEVDLPFMANATYRVNVLMMHSYVNGFYPYAFQLVDATSGKLYAQENLVHVPPPFP